MEEKIIAQNKRVLRNFEILDTVEAGLQLEGYEAKAAREGKVNLNGSYVKEKNGELFIYNMFIAANPSAHNVKGERRRRKLLLHKYEIIRWITRAKEKGLTILPVDVHTSNNRIKVTIALVRAKKMFGNKKKIEEKRIKEEMHKARRLR
ncbi:MAG: SsrA-binding protein SmpB [Caldisericaceae bacterium]|jgi:SsrA-binding protein|nr:SsrA-binding protein SmpB [Caldisericaceae bacterium]